MKGGNRGLIGLCVFENSCGFIAQTCHSKISPNTLAHTHTYTHTHTHTHTTHTHRHVGASGGPELPRAVPPQILCAVLTSPQLVGKKNIGIVDELFQLIQVCQVKVATSRCVTIQGLIQNRKKI